MRTLKAPDQDRMIDWPYSRNRFSEINAEMADEILREIGELLRPLPCMHGKDPGDNVAEMFYAERIMCIMNALRKRVIELGGADPFKHLKREEKHGD